MLHEEVEKYINLSGDKEAWQNTPVCRIGGYLDGYDRGLEVLDEIRSEIEQIIGEHNLDDYDFCSGLICARNIIDKHKAESEEIK